MKKFTFWADAVRLKTRFSFELMPDRPVSRSRPVSFAPGRSHGPNAGRPGVIPRGETMGTLEEKLFSLSVYDEDTALIQESRLYYT